MIDTKAFYQALLKKQTDFFAGVPDSLLQHLCACIQENSPADRNIITANEGNAIALASGYHIATGKYGVVYMQNSGLGNTVNPLLSLADADVYAIPMLLLIGWRGEPGMQDEPQHITQGRLTLPLLDTMQIRWMVLDENYTNQLDECYHYMQTQQKPIALVVKKGTFSAYPLTLPAPRFALKREPALEIILDNVAPDSLVVSTTGKTSREIFEIRERNQQGHALDFLTVGAMGHTASIAFGMSLGTDKNVYCIDGDGSFLMHMGGLAVAVQKNLHNFKYILLNNGAHESVGGQPTIALELDIPQMLKGMGFQQVVTAQTPEQIRTGTQALSETSQSALIVHLDQGSREALGRPTIPPKQNKQDMMAMLQKG